MHVCTTYITARRDARDAPVHRPETGGRIAPEEQDL